MIGSFVNVVALRKINGKKFYKGFSHCESCQVRIPWFDNIPIISFFLLRRKCRNCGSEISLQYPIVEFLVGVIFLIATTLNLSITNYILFVIICSVMTVISIIDLKQQIIFQVHLVILAILIITLKISTGLEYTFLNFLSGSLLFGLFILLLRLIGGFIYKREAMGIGDVKLALVCGFLLNWQLTIVAIYISIISASIIGIFQMYIIKRPMEILPFAPFISLGTVFSFIYGNKIIYAFLSII
ncbi:MAG TPA: prepilin peptidase [Candidatus Marinimicrobia bacterium]|nr:prepilin peptidase [Candidatus Neomarinimicrobiota bacterium]